jgi:RIO kinase 1
VGLNRVNEDLSELDAFVASAYITDVLGVVKSGKEATVYCVRGGDRLGGRLIAAKVYRTMKVRQFANAAVYNAGRLRQPHKREARAMMRRSAFGQQTAFNKWVGDEYETLNILYNAGVSVPQPLQMAERVILMEYIGDGDEPAPLLNAVNLTQDEARAAFGEIVGSVEQMLACDRIHGDLSPYNVLYHHGRTRIIDVPQSVDARFNPNALDLLQRDVSNICRHFERLGVRGDSDNITRGLWARYLRSEL